MKKYRQLSVEALQEVCVKHGFIPQHMKFMLTGNQKLQY